MNGDTGVSAGKGLHVFYWMVSSYTTAVCTVLLLCLLDIPSALLAVAFGFSTGVFILLSIIPVAAAIFAIQRGRVGERVASAILGAAARRTMDFGQVQQVREADALWNDMQPIARKATTEHGLVRQARNEIVSLKTAVSEHELLVARLREWADSPGEAPASTAEVERLVRRQHVLVREINRTLRSLADDDTAIRQAQRTINATSELFDARWDELKSRLQQAQRSLPPTFWTQCETFYRNRRIRSYEHAYKESRDAIMGWTIDLAPAMQRLNQGLQLLEGKTIQCRDGRVTLSLETISTE